MLLFLSRYIKNNRGQAIVEFALVFPWLILMLVGVIEFGLILNQYMVMSEAAREGARSAALGADNATVTAAVQAAVSSQSIDKSRITVSINPSGARVRGNAVTVTAAYPVKTITQMMSVFFTGTPTVEGSATMRVE
jgi:Flp pilus assembly protein TadG